MAKLDNTRRIIKEDYESKYHDLIGKLGYVLNTFMEQTVNVLNGNVDAENLKKSRVTAKMKVDSNGVPIGNNLIKSDVTQVTGITVKRATNKTNSSNYPTGQPFISWTGGTNSGVVKIKHITGLQANEEYELVIDID